MSIFKKFGFAWVDAILKKVDLDGAATTLKAINAKYPEK